MRSISTVVFVCAFFLCLGATEPDLAAETNVSIDSNATLPRSGEDTFAKMLDRALEKEFNESEQSEATDRGSFNNSVAGEQAVLETVARVKSKKNDSKEEKSFQFQHVFNLDNDNGAEDTPTLIDRKVLLILRTIGKLSFTMLEYLL
uniref:Uncharacterized protein n=1 Tax=Rhizophora mucronata TaxID=61149 RepID=A0A2P2IS39_RHIMU